MSTIRYHWIITIQRGSRPLMRTREGIVQPDPGETRQELYYRICDELGEPQPYAVLFFSLEPDEILTGIPDDLSPDSRNGERR